MLDRKELRGRLERHGGDILSSRGMACERGFLQHGNTSVFEHSVRVTVACLVVAEALRLAVNERALVRGALLHDYFLYDWHDRSTSRPHHATRHGAYALENAERDFELGVVERDMIASHMFPLAPMPRHREGWVLTLADKGVSAGETIAGLVRRVRGKGPRGSA